MSGWCSWFVVGLTCFLCGCATSEYDLLLQAKSTRTVERHEALVELSQLEETSYIPLFVAALSPEQPAMIRMTGVTALGKFQEEEIVEPLLLVLKDPSPLVRMEVARVLGNYPKKEVVKGLIERFEVEEDVWVKQKIVESLRKIGTEECIFLLIKAVGDPNEEVSKNAQLALRSLTGHFYGKNLDQWARWWTLYNLKKN